MKRAHTTLEVFTVTVPNPDNPGVERTFYFTTDDRPVTYDGHQYIPLSVSDAARWLKEDLSK